MSTLTGQYISASYGGVIHLSTNQSISVGTYTRLEDGLGNNLGILVNGQGYISASVFKGNVQGDVTGNVIGNVTGNLTGNVTGNVVGNLTGTASFANNATSASYARNATSASYAQIASFASIATSASYSTSASFSRSGSFAQNASTASYLLGSIESASFATTASYAFTASFVRNAVSASYALNASNAVSSSYAISSSSALSSSYALTSSFAISASAAFTSSFAMNANLFNGTASSILTTFATTGSNTFKGNQIISGSITLTSGSFKTNNVITVTPSSNTASLDLSRGNYFQVTTQPLATVHVVATNVTPGQSFQLAADFVSSSLLSDISFASNFLFPSASFPFFPGNPTTQTRNLFSFSAYSTSSIYTVYAQAFITS
jgi:hypothetical protein